MTQRYAARTDKGGRVKKFGYLLIGLLLAGMTITCAVGGGIFGYAFAVAFGALTYRAFRALGRLAPAPATPRRPWE